MAAAAKLLSPPRAMLYIRLATQRQKSRAHHEHVLSQDCIEVTFRSGGGIRTPIAGSKGPRPTVRRPPNSLVSHGACSIF